MSDERKYEEGEYTDEEIAADIARFEQQYGMSSEEFIKRWREDTVPDTFETNLWAMLLKYHRGEPVDDTLEHPPTIHNPKETVMFVMSSEEHYTDLNRQLVASQERAEQLEAMLREMVYPNYPDAYWDYDGEWEQYTCGYCLGCSDTMIRKPGRSSEIQHAADCPVAKARVLLDKQG